MAKNQKTRKQMTSKTKGVIALAVLLVITLVVSYIGIAGLQLGPEQSRKLLPWMPMGGDMDAYNLSRSLGDYVVYDFTLDLADENASVDDYMAAVKARYNHYGAKNVKMEKTGDNTVSVTVPTYDEADLIASLANTVGAVTFCDEAGNVLLDNDDVESADVLYANGYYYIEMKINKDTLLAASEATTGATMPIYMDGMSMMAPEMSAPLTEGNLTITFGMDEYASRGMAAMLECGALNVGVAEATSRVVENDAPAMTAVLLVVWAIFVVACALMVIRFRAAGLGAAWTLWAYMLLFFFLMCTVTLVLCDVAVWVVVVVGEIFAVYALSEQLKSVKQAALAGRDIAAAVRLGFKTTSKKVWLAHAVVLAVALLLMILNVTRPLGYTLATCVVSSVIACMVLSRLFVPCLVSVAGGKTAK